MASSHAYDSDVCMNFPSQSIMLTAIIPTDMWLWHKIAFYTEKHGLRMVRSDSKD